MNTSLSSVLYCAVQTVTAPPGKKRKRQEDVWERETEGDKRNINTHQRSEITGTSTFHSNQTTGSSVTDDNTQHQYGWGGELCCCIHRSEATHGHCSSSSDKLSSVLTSAAESIHSVEYKDCVCVCGWVCERSSQGFSMNPGCTKWEFGTKTVIIICLPL